MRWGKYFAAFALILTLAACGGGGGGGGSAGGTGGDTPTRFTGRDLPDLTNSCASLQFQRLQAAPLEGIVVTGVDDVLADIADDPVTPIAARILVDGDVRGAMPVRRVTEQGQPALQVGVPAHPDTPWQGGNVDIVLAFGDETCNARTVTVTGLSEPSRAPRSIIDDAVTALSDALAQRAAMFGFASVQGVLDERDALDDGSQTSFSVPELLLISAADGLETLQSVTSDQALSDEAERLLAAMLEGVGAQGFVDGLAALNLTMSGYSGTVVNPDNLARATIIDSDSGDYIQTMAAGGGSGACGAAIMGDPMTINDAAALNHYMGQQADAVDASNSMGNDALDFLGLALPAAGLVGGPVGSAVGAGAGAMIYVYKLVQDITINTLPSRFDSIDLVLNPGATFPEDYVEAGNAKPRWEQALATVSSNGMNLTGQVIDAAMQVFGAAKWAGGLGGQSTVLGEVRGALDDAGLGYAVNLLKGLIGNDAIDCFKVDSWTWSGIDIADDEYTDARVIGDSISLSMSGIDVNQQTMTLEQTGWSDLIVETRDDRFGGTYGKVTEAITVRELALMPDPPIYWVQTPGEPKTIDIEVVTDPELPDKALSAQKQAGGGSITQQPAYLSGNMHRMTLSTPSDENQYPMEVEVRRIATVPDAGGSLVRRATVTIRNDEELELTPASRCIGRGETLDLTAQVFGKSSLGSGDLTWELTSGGGSVSPGAVDGVNLTQAGTYTAPSGATTAQVKVSFTDSNGDEVADYSDIAVGTCDAQVFIDGNFSVDADASDDHYDFDSDTDVLDLPDLPNPAILPPAGLAWHGRSQYFQGNGDASGDVEVDCNQVLSDGGCADYAERTIKARSFGESNIGADADGNVQLDMAFSGQDECVPADDSYSAVGSDPECSSADASSGWDIRYYMDIEEPSRQQLDITLECTENGDAMGTILVAMTALRVPSDGDPTQDLLPIGLQSLDDLYNGDLTPEEIAELSDQLTNGLSAEPLEDPCGTPDGKTEFSTVMDVPGPVDPDAADRGLISIAVGTVGFMPEGHNKDEIRQLLHGDYADSYSTGSVPSANQLSSMISDARPGSYYGSVDIRVSISLSTVN